jgi:hypothetical protein
VSTANRAALDLGAEMQKYITLTENSRLLMHPDNQAFFLIGMKSMRAMVSGYLLTHDVVEKEFQGA